MKRFLEENLDFFLILILVILGSNAHVLLHGFFPEDKMFNVYLVAQQFSGAPVLFTFVYFLSVKKQFIIKKSLSLSLVALSILSFAGELFELFDVSILSQWDKGITLACEIVFISTVFTIGIIRFKKDA